ncbi:hypothetical protein KY285_024861 [Solanum tuberosum]|nr:hypothetical protein KY289_025064 [Solanum tuberosum]KAH0673774.1 hypothetical protein KY284_024861 [Solanum tuberosum]KAH0677060.1 hypothetical protein KY285_024861 [Solanum tuberosum]
MTSIEKLNILIEFGMMNFVGLVESFGVASSGATPFILSVHAPQAEFAVASDSGLLPHEPSAMFVETKGLGHRVRSPYAVFTMVKEVDPSCLQDRCRIRRFKGDRTLVSAD